MLASFSTVKIFKSIEDRRLREGKNKDYRNCNNPAAVPSLVMKPSNWRRTLQSALAEEREIALPDEFERVFRAHHGLVFRTAYRITGNAADAEDVSQMVFLRLFRREAGAPVLEMKRVTCGGRRSTRRWM